ncbi:UNVERIFIED_CONTAM: 30S ribosomal protein 2, chloroplastic [Sesamum angustifolium]|uniref:30S ribosomal protein 2, chloroplastic n=1 Tax=Sesamum angustifolium TaxID=2727405 RepID=A0AAW2RIV5_9LAMI
MATLSSSSSSIISPSFLQNPRNPFKAHLPKLHFHPLRPQIAPLKFTHLNPRRFNAVAEDTSVATADPSSVAARRLYVGNIPRTVTNDELQKIVEEHGAVEKAEVMYDKYSGRSRRFAFVTMKTVEDANAAVEKLNGTEIGGREIKVNITENHWLLWIWHFFKPRNLKKGKVVSAKVSRVPGTSKSSGYGFVAFSSEEDVEAAISSLNNAVLDGQKIRVNKA